MKFSPDSAFKNNLITALQEKYNKERAGVHISDIVYCLREAYYRKTDPQPLSETDLMFFADGAERHSVLERLSGLRSEVEILWAGIRGTVDIVDSCPVEIKSTRSNKDLPMHYFTQLGYYCAMLDSAKGVLLVQRLNNREQPWECLRVEWTPEEIQAIRDDLESKAALLTTALNEKRPSILPKCQLPPDEAGEPWKCRYCLYKRLCNTLPLEDSNNANTSGTSKGMVSSLVSKESCEENTSSSSVHGGTS